MTSTITRGVSFNSLPLRARRGYSLIELLTVVAIVGLFVAVSTPHFLSLRRQAAMRAATKEIRGVIQKTRARAITRSRNSAVKFQLFGDEWRYAIYDDGDFDGVRNDDIAKGIDPVVIPFTPVLPGAGRVRIGLPAAGARDPDTNKLLVPSKDSPVRFNASTLCSFSPAGSGTPGTVFLTDGHTDIGAVRVFGATGRIRSQMFNRATGKWESR
jgi:prepilin-type N-terminal cleavage/methylation domain-containing protein